MRPHLDRSGGSDARPRKEMRSRFSRMLPSPSNSRPAFDRTRPEFDRMRPGFDHMRRGFDRSRPGFDRIRPEFDHTRPGFHRSRSSSASIRGQHSSRRPNHLDVAALHSPRLRSSSLVGPERSESRPETRGAPTRRLRKPLSAFAQRHSKPPHPRSSSGGPLPRRRRTRREFERRLPTSQEPTREFPDPLPEHGEPTCDLAEPLTSHKWAARPSPRGAAQAPRCAQRSLGAALCSRTADPSDLSPQTRTRTAVPQILWWGPRVRSAALSTRRTPPRTPRPSPGACSDSPRACSDSPRLAPTRRGLAPTRRGLAPTRRGLAPPRCALAPAVHELVPALDELAPALDELAPALSAIFGCQADT